MPLHVRLSALHAASQQCIQSPEGMLMLELGQQAIASIIIAMHQFDERQSLTTQPSTTLNNTPCCI